ncbi:MAG: ribose-phosphate diphosphokinase [Methanosarcinales archaeon Met12]|nr:MAG: ribose-phosphate diphosphokinase [Methanosarcinales archaeon Met12]
MKIISGPASQLLATRVAKELDCDILLAEYKRFPDGEACVRVLDEIGDDVLIIQSTVSDGDLIYLLQLVDACEEVERVRVVIPYFRYARQERTSHPGEPISARAIARTIDADEIFTVNIHDPSVLGHFNGPAHDLDVAPLIGDYIRSLDLDRPIIIAPDDGACALARSSASKLGIDYDVLEKIRLNGEDVEIKPKHIDIMNRDVVIVDDIISTGETMVEAIELLWRQKPNDIYVACVHPVLARNALIRLFKAGIKELIATDTIENGASIVSAAPVIAKAVE